MGKVLTELTEVSAWFHDGDIWAQFTPSSLESPEMYISEAHFYCKSLIKNINIRCCCVGGKKNFL